MRSANYMSGKEKELISLVKKSSDLMGGKELKSFINMISRNKAYLPFLITSNLMGLTGLQTVSGRLSDVISPRNREESMTNDSFKIMNKKIYNDNLTINKFDSVGGNEHLGSNSLEKQTYLNLDEIKKKPSLEFEKLNQKNLGKIKIDEEQMSKAKKFEVGGYDVYFPHEPYGIQKNFIGKLVEA